MNRKENVITVNARVNRNRQTLLSVACCCFMQTSDLLEGEAEIQLHCDFPGQKLSQNATNRSIRLGDSEREQRLQQAAKTLPL